VHLRDASAIKRGNARMKQVLVMRKERGFCAVRGAAAGQARAAPP